MKKLYRKNVIHPTPSDHLLYLLPSALLTLTAALSSEERQVLAYLISSSSSSSSSSNNHNHNHRKIKNHPSSFDCYCFNCYTCYWVKWDSSPNRQLIHEILDGFEDEFLNENKKDKGKKKNRGLKGKKKACCKEKDKVSVELDEVKKCDTMENDNGIGIGIGIGIDGVSAVGDETIETSNVEEEEEDEEEEETEKGSIRRFVSFVGERIWGVWQV